MSDNAKGIDLVIVGGVAAGASAATRARRLSEASRIVIFERGADVSFANCGMPYHIGDVIADRSKLAITTPERLRERFALDVRVRSEVVSIDRRAKTVRVRELATGREYDQPYDKLLLAPGAAPFRPPIPGADLPGIHVLRDLGDMDRIRQTVDRGIDRAVILGGGFIGLELVENLVHRKVATTLVERNEQVLGPLDREMTLPLRRTLEQHQVDLRLGRQAIAIESRGERFVVRLDDGSTVEAGLVVIGVGVRPENALAVAAGLEIGPRGGIRVDRTMRTSDPDIYAAGDVVETRDDVMGQPVQVPLAGPANRQGRLAADAIFGREVQFRGTQATAVLGLFGTTAALTGLSEKQAEAMGIEYATAFIHPMHHAGYYPGAEGMTLKLVFDPRDGRVLGAQGVGGAGVDKRIDVLAIAIQARMTVFDLEQSELCYAPQFGSAKDPINMLGFVAAGLMRGDHPQWSMRRYLSLPIETRPYSLDVRTPSEFTAGTIPGAVNLPVDELRSRLNELPQDRPIAVFCQVGQRGYLATRILRQNGFDAFNLGGGYRTYLLHRDA